MKSLLLVLIGCAISGVAFAQVAASIDTPLHWKKGDGGEVFQALTKAQKSDVVKKDMSDSIKNIEELYRDGGGEANDTMAVVERDVLIDGMSARQIVCFSLLLQYQKYRTNQRQAERLLDILELFESEKNDDHWWQLRKDARQRVLTEIRFSRELAESLKIKLDWWKKRPDQAAQTTSDK